MKAICQNCAFAETVESELKELAMKAAKIRSEPILNTEKREKIKALKGGEVVEESVGVDTMTFKTGIPADRKAAIDYMKCSSREHLDGSGCGPEKKFIIHKYYFACEHFKEVE